jgi:hypothetical protein
MTTGIWCIAGLFAFCVIAFLVVIEAFCVEDKDKEDNVSGGM